MSFREKIESGEFVITAEVGPPKGTNVGPILDDAEKYLKGTVDAVNVTDLQSAVMRVNAVVTCYLIKQRGMEPILQVACRDRNRLALQADLLSAAVLGLENIMALTGDHMVLGDHPEAKPVFDLDSVTLLQAIQTLQSGRDMAGEELDGIPKFFPGAAVSPGFVPIELQIMKMEKKVKSGARFFQTQAVYDPERFIEFSKKVKYLDVPVLVGIVIPKSERMLRYMDESVAGVNVPPELIERMANAKSRSRTGIQIAAEIIRQVKPFCHGIHFMTLGWDKHIPVVLEAAGLVEKKSKTTD